MINDRARKEATLNIFNRLPVFRNGFVKVYCPDVPHNEFATGWNHSTNSQIYQHSIYFYLISKLGRQDQEVCNALRLFFHRSIGLISGYRFENGNIVHSNEYCNPEYMSAVALAVSCTTDDMVVEEFEQCLAGIIDNNYGFKDEYGRIYSCYSYTSNSLHLMSGLSLFNGKSIFFTKHLNNLFLNRLGFLFSLHLNSIPDYIAAYILTKNTTGFKSLFFKSVLKLNYILSKKFKKNAFVSGLVDEIFPNTLNVVTKTNLIGNLFANLPNWFDKEKKKRLGLAWLADFCAIDSDYLKRLINNG